MRLEALHPGVDASSRSATTPASSVLVDATGRSPTTEPPHRPTSSHDAARARSRAAASSDRQDDRPDRLRPRHPQLRRPRRDARHRRALRATPQRAEALGFESLWAWDHVLLGVEPSFPILDAITTLAAIAARTRTIKLGTGVLVLPLRNPIVAAKALGSLDVISQGPADPRRRRRLVRARVRRGRRAVQAARPAVRAQPRHPHPAVDRGPRDPAGGRVQPARGGHGPAHRAAAAAAHPDRRLRRRRAQARGRRWATAG